MDFFISSQIILCQDIDQKLEIKYLVILYDNRIIQPDL